MRLIEYFIQLFHLGLFTFCFIFHSIILGFLCQIKQTLHAMWDRSHSYFILKAFQLIAIKPLLMHNWNTHRRVSQRLNFNLNYTQNASGCKNICQWTWTLCLFTYRNWIYEFCMAYKMQRKHMTKNMFFIKHTFSRSAYLHTIHKYTITYLKRQCQW